MSSRAGLEAEAEDELLGRRRTSTMCRWTDAEDEPMTRAGGGGRVIAAPASVLRGRRIVLGVCGGIAAYKAVEVCRRLVDAGALVSPVMTRGATRFVGPGHVLGPGVGAGPHLAVGRARAHSAHPAGSDRRPDRGGPGHGPPHRQLRGGDLRRTCSPPPCWPPGRRCWSARPCTPRCGSTRPSWTTSPCCAGGASTWCEPATGRLAGGDVGRRAGWPSRPTSSPPPAGQASAGGAAARGRPCAGEPGRRRVVVTAGGTREPIDPVRFIGNRSSGKQGYAIAAELAGRGAQRHPGQHRRPCPHRPASRSSRSRPPPRWKRRCWPAPAAPT